MERMCVRERYSMSKREDMEVQQQRDRKYMDKFTCMEIKVAHEHINSTTE